MDARRFVLFGLLLNLAVVSKISFIFTFPVSEDVIDAILAAVDNPSNAQFISKGEIIPPCGMPLLLSSGLIIVL